MNTPTRAVPLLTLAVAAASLLAACSDGGSGGKKKSSAFLQIEARVDRDPAGASDGIDPRILAVGDDVFAVWEDDRTIPSHVRFNRSLNGGRDWLPSDPRIPGTAAGGIGAEHPCLACDGGTIFVAFEEEQVSGFEDMYVNRSTDGGLTWQATATRLDPGPAGTTDSENPAICLEAGVVMVAWMEGDAVTGLRDILFARSLDDGLTWSAPVRLDTDAAGAAWSQSVRLCAAGANVFAVWEDDRNGQRDVYFNRSTDSGGTWLGADVRLDAAAGAAESSRVGLACNGDEVYVVWTDDRDGDRDLYFRRSSDAGSSWDAEVRLDTTAGGVDVDGAAFAGSGSLLAVGWEASSTGPEEDVFVNVSADGGLTWLGSEARLDTDAAGSADSGDVALCVEGSSVHAAWVDSRNGLDDVYFSTSTDLGASWSAPELFVEQDAPGAAQSSQPGVACSPAGVWVVWRENRAGGQDIFVNGGQP